VTKGQKGRGTRKSAARRTPSNVTDDPVQQNRQRMLEVLQLVAVPQAFAPLIAGLITLGAGHPEVWFPVVQFGVLLLTLAYYVGIRYKKPTPVARKLRTLIGLVLVVGAIVLGRVLQLPLWQVIVLSILGIGLPFATKLSNKLGTRKRGRVAFSARQLAEAVVAGTAVTTVCLIVALKVWAATPATARSVVFYADFVAWEPSPTAATGADLPVERGGGGPRLPPVDIYQEAVYLVIEELDWHIGGTFTNKSSSPAGQLRARVLYPPDVPVAYSVENRSGIPHQVCTYSFPLGNIHWLATRTNHYNCFGIDHHSYGWTLRTDARKVDVTFDFSRLGKEAVFDLSEAPRIIRIDKPHLTGSPVPVDSVLWNSASVLHAQLGPLEEGTQLVLDCKWKQNRDSP
jgi:hypothetical protein